MDITTDGTRLRLSFAYDRRIVERVRQIPGATFDDSDKCWYAPAAQLARCEALFPRAHYDYACWAAEAAAHRRWAEQHIAMLTHSGATFSVTEDDVVLVAGDCVSPLVAEVIRDRSAWVLPYLPVASAKTGAQGASERATVEPTHFDRVLAAGIANAVQAEAEKRSYAQRPRRRGAVQGSLFSEETRP